MELQDHAGCHWHGIVPFVDHVEHEPVSGYLTLVSILRFGPFGHQVAKPFVRGRDILDLV